MIRAGQIVLFRFPLTGRPEAKLRPALVLRCVPGRYDDWLICMVSTQLRQCIAGLDDLITGNDADFKQSGLKHDSVIRATHLAVVDASLFLGVLGEVAPHRLDRVRRAIAGWIAGEKGQPS